MSYAFKVYDEISFEQFNYNITLNKEEEVCLSDTVHVVHYGQITLENLFLSSLVYHFAWE